VIQTHTHTHIVGAGGRRARLERAVVVLPDGVARRRTLWHRSRRVTRIKTDCVASRSRCDMAPTFALLALAAPCVPKKA
jgi:hypothetical protein